MDVKFIKGTAQQYASATKVPTTFYYLTDTNQVYLGSILLSGDTAAEIPIADSNNKFLATNVEDALTELASAITGTGTAGEVTIVKRNGTGANAPDTDMLVSYDVKQGGILVDTINIPKDLVAVSGEIVSSYTDDQSQTHTGTFIKLTIQNGSPFYIDVADLIEYNTFTSTDEVVFTDSNHSVSAAIGTVAANKIIYKTAAQNSGTAVYVSDALDAANNLAATVSGGTSPLSLQVIQGSNGKISSVSGSIASGTYDAYGAAANVLGQDGDASTAPTVYGVKAALNNLSTYVSGLDTTVTAASVNSSSVVTLTNKIVQTDGLISTSGTPIDLAVVAKTGAASNVSLADTGSYYTATNVEAAFAEIYNDLNTALTWQNFPSS